MSTPFYAKGPGNEGYIKNLDVVGFNDLNGISGMFQMGLYKTNDGKYYLYGTCHSRTVKGILITDVTDPQNPVFIKHLPIIDTEEYPTTSIPKLQIANGLMILAMTSGGGPAELLGKRVYERKSENGIRIYDIKTDPLNPQLLSYWDTGVPFSLGVHRFMYDGGRYVHLSADARGFEGMIYRIVDIQDPKHPVEVGRWWYPEQFADGYPSRSFNPSADAAPSLLSKPCMHGPPFVVGDRAYLGYCGAGLIVLDISDITRPRSLGQLTFMPTFGSKLAGARTHTALPLPGRDLCVVTNEGERFSWFTPEKIKANGPQAMNNIHMVDVSDPTQPTLIAEFPYPEVPENFPYRNFNEAGLGVAGPFGPHNLHEPMQGKPWLEQRGDRVYCCYFHAGLRVYDVSDPYYIKEIAYFIPPNPTAEYFPGFPGPNLATTEDWIVDDRGYIYIDALQDGLYILKMKD